MKPSPDSEYEDRFLRDLAPWRRSESARERMGTADDYGSLAMEEIVRGRTGRAVCIGFVTWLLAIVLLALLYLGPAALDGFRPADPIAIGRVRPGGAARASFQEAGPSHRADDGRHETQR
jgi:hypothetical protein